MTRSEELRYDRMARDWGYYDWIPIRAYWLRLGESVPVKNPPPTYDDQGDSLPKPYSMTVYVGCT
jgi:hypothetical protein